MRTLLRNWWWLPLIVIVALVIKSTLLAGWVSGVARSEAAEAADLPLERVEVDGLDVTLTGFSSRSDRDAAVAAVEALDSSRSVVGLMADDADSAGSTAGGSDDGSSETAGEEVAGGSSDDEDATDPATGTAGGDGAADEAAGSTDTADGERTAGSDGARSDLESEAADLRAPSIELELSESGVVVVSGAVAGEDLRSGLLEGVSSAFGAEEVTDELTVDPTSVGSEGGVLLVRGEAGSEGQRSSWLTASSAVAESLGLQLVDELAIVRVEGALDALLTLEPIEFDPRKATLRPEALAILDVAGEIINADPGAGRVRVIGHTDSDGGPIGNRKLSERRARAVMDYLVGEGGVPTDRLEAIGLGEDRLLVEPDHTAQDKQRNRRIEWELVS